MEIAHNWGGNCRQLEGDCAEHKVAAASIWEGDGTAGVVTAVICGTAGTAGVVMAHSRGQGLQITGAELQAAAEETASCWRHRHPQHSHRLWMRPLPRQPRKPPAAEAPWSLHFLLPPDGVPWDPGGCLASPHASPTCV